MKPSVARRLNTAVVPEMSNIENFVRLYRSHLRMKEEPRRSNGLGRISGLEGAYSTPRFDMTLRNDIVMIGNDGLPSPYDEKQVQCHVRRR